MMWHPVPYLICSFHNHHFFFVLFVQSTNYARLPTTKSDSSPQSRQALISCSSFTDTLTFFFAHSHVHSAAYGHIMFCSEKICVMNKNDHKIWTLDRPQYSSLETPWPFNYSTTHLVRHDLLQGNCNFFLSIFLFCLLQHICHKPH